MAISRVSDAEAIAMTAATGLSVPAPTGIGAGDLLLMLHGMLSASVAITAEPSDTTSQGSASSGANLSARVKSKIAASEPASYDWTVASALKQLAWVGVYRGVDETTPVADAAVTAGASATTTVTTPAVDVPEGGWLVYGVVTRHSPGAVGMSTWSSSAGAEVQLASLASNAGSADITGAVFDSGGPLSAATGVTRTLTSTMTENVSVVWAVAIAPKTTVPPPIGDAPQLGMPIS